VGPDIATIRTYTPGVLANDFDNQDCGCRGCTRKSTADRHGQHQRSTITRRDSDGTEIVYTYNVSAQLTLPLTAMALTRNHLQR